MPQAVLPRTSPAPAAAVAGLTREEEQRPAGQYLEAFPWEGVVLDPNQLSAEAFLDEVF